MADIPPLVEAWVNQLLDPHVVDLINAAGDRNVDIRLSAAKGKVRPNPVITINASGGVSP